MRSPVRSPGRPLRLAAAVAVAGLAAAAGAGLAPPAATAVAADQVSFTGGCGLLGTGLGGELSSDASQLRVPAGARVEFVNRLDRAATLRLDGESVAEVAKGDSAEVTFFDGPVTATMQIGCPLGDPSGAVTVDVVDDPLSAARPTPAQPASPGTSPSGASTRSAPGAGPSPSSRTVGGVARTPAAESPPEPAGSGDPGASAHQPAPRWEAPTGPDAGDPAAPGGWWPGERPGQVRDDAKPDDAVPDVATGSERATPGAGAASAPADGSGSTSITRTAEASPGDEPIGLLALVATICVVGVSAGAVRAILTQRANRAEWV